MRRTAGMVALMLIVISPGAGGQTPVGSVAAPASSVAPALLVDKPFEETAAQAKRRKEFVERTRIQIRSTVTANNKEVTDEERELIARHWRRAMRLYRVRDLAEDTLDTDTAGRVEPLLQKVGIRFYERLRDLNSKAPKRALTGLAVPVPQGSSK